MLIYSKYICLVMVSTYFVSFHFFWYVLLSTEFLIFHKSLFISLFLFMLWLNCHERETVAYSSLMKFPDEKTITKEAMHQNNLVEFKHSERRGLVYSTFPMRYVCVCACVHECVCVCENKRLCSN